MINAPRFRRIALWTAVICAALALRVPQLADRPMHADEAVLAAKLGELLDSVSYRYDPTEHHGPALAWLTFAAARLTGAHHYTELTESLLRAVPVFCAIVLMLSALLLVEGLGRWEAAAAAAFIAISPAMVYYSRYFIPEMLLTALTGLTIGFGYRYTRAGNIAWAAAAGLAAGLMLVTKETAAIAIACMLIAAAYTHRTKLIRTPHIILAVAVAAAIPLATLGFTGVWQAILSYTQKAVEVSGHAKPWHYYLGLLGWQELGIVALAAFQIKAGLAARSVGRFLVIYAITLTIAYSAIPYKTPWCVLGPLYAMALLAGAGATRVFRSIRAAPSIALAAVLAAAIGYQAWRISFPLSSDARNPYAYAHTSRDVYVIREAIEELTRHNRQLTIQVVSSQNLWPLPWYLRTLPNVGWWRRIEPNFRSSDIILITPEVEPALIHEIYEAPPPGRRELYRPVFDRYIELRPGLELRGYVKASLAQ